MAVAEEGAAREELKVAVDPLRFAKSEEENTAYTDRAVKAFDGGKRDKEPLFVSPEVVVAVRWLAAKEVATRRVKLMTNVKGPLGHTRI